ncbi:MAG: hypothetical protein ACRENE_29235, partial [Polyangiaceae bacterium]
MYAYLLAEPVVTYVSSGDPDAAGLSLRLHALLYGAPLILGLFLAQGVGASSTFPLSRLLDPLTWLMV